MRRAKQNSRQLHSDFNPRTSCEVRLQGINLKGQWSVISIHAPHARCDILCFYLAKTTLNFNPRTSCEVRHPWLSSKIPNYIISIHAPHARCDHKSLTKRIDSNYFNPRTSCEVRLAIICFTKSSLFQSTHLMRGATRRSWIYQRIRLHFNPRTSCEVRP